jgi:hypothetical protein
LKWRRYSLLRPRPRSLPRPQPSTLRSTLNPQLTRRAREQKSSTGILHFFCPSLPLNDISLPVPARRIFGVGFVRKTRATIARMAIRATHPDYDSTPPECGRPRPQQHPRVLCIDCACAVFLSTLKPTNAATGTPSGYATREPIATNRVPAVLTNFIPVLHTTGCPAEAGCAEACWFSQQFRRWAKIATRPNPPTGAAVFFVSQPGVFR